MKSKYEIWRGVNKEWRWRFKAGNGETIASGEGYKNEADCRHAIELLKSSADCEVVNLTPHEATHLL